MRGRVVAYSSSPLLASRTPVWRSKFIVAGLALAFSGWPAAPPGCRCSATTSTCSQGEVRFARTLELPANRGRIFDRNGLLLATSVPCPASGRSPRTWKRDKRKLAQLAKLLQLPLPN
jgi:cell division protein FtsI (penicillin-binding protein 3)